MSWNSQTLESILGLGPVPNRAMAKYLQFCNSADKCKILIVQVIN